MPERISLSTYLVITVFLVCSSLASGQTDFVTFESGLVRPIVLSPDGSRLFVANTADAHLEVYDTAGGGEPVQIASIPVGLEPVAVAAVDNDTAWVANHLSDSVSIVSVSQGRVVRT
ncbi:MAG: hypothetical protein NZ990_12760, partial [Myxococcota bacterium]|nr:hypothetical protein [Myxococcota bacterium]